MHFTVSWNEPWIIIVKVIEYGVHNFMMIYGLNKKKNPQGKPIASFFSFNQNKIYFSKIPEFLFFTEFEQMSKKIRNKSIVSI